MKFPDFFEGFELQRKTSPVMLQLLFIRAENL